MKIKLLLLCMVLASLTNLSMAQFNGGNGTKAMPYQIATASQLDSVRYYLSSHFVQTSDIDLGSYNWNPIGNGSNWFKGSYNGNGFSIHNLFIDIQGYSSNIGLFGYYRPATAYDTIQNITLNNLNITAYSNVGGIVGFAYYPLNIINCRVQGQLIGVAGVGGILGSAQYNVHVSNCFANVIINCTASNGGGIAGGFEGSNSSITNCFTSGTIYCANSGCGGISGFLNLHSTISNCYSTMDIIGLDNDQSSQVGGITGRAWNWSTIQNCYSTGIIKAESSASGINGNDYFTTYKNNIAINPRVSSYSNATINSLGRISTYEWNNIYLKNYAWEHTYLQDSMVVNGTAGNKNGANVSLALLSDSTNFYLNDTLWNGGAWDFTNTWTINTAVSPFPILKTFAGAIQNIKHSQEIFWVKPLAGGINDTVTEPAIGGMGPITYFSSNPAIVEVIGNNLIVKGSGVANITASVAETEFYKSYSVTKAFTVFEGGAGTKENPFLIATAAQLDNVRNNLSAHYKLIADIDLSGYDNWQPIGHSYFYFFSGSFDGNNYTISNLTINRPSQSDIGLFGKYNPATDGDSLKNIILDNVNIIGSINIGAIAGDVRKGFIHNCHSSGIVKGYSSIGGIAGALSYYGSAMKTPFVLGASHCSSSCKVEASNSIAGGIIGYAWGEYDTKKSTKTTYLNGIIQYCSSTGDINATNRAGGIAGEVANYEILNCYNTGKIRGNDNAGGLAGYAVRYVAIENSFNAGSIIINEDNAGGLIGHYVNSDTSVTASITNCYSTGDIISQTQLRTGGIVGYAENPINIAYSYSTGYVRSANLSGGIAGDLTSSIVSNCFVANAKIQSGGGAGRLVCDNDGESIFHNNYAWNNLFVKDSLISWGTLDNYQGQNINIEQLGNLSFFTNNANWHNQAWDFTNVWMLDTENTSPYPILKDFNPILQKVKHAQKITWTQDLNAFTGDTVTLTAAGGVNILTYTSSNPLIANINGNMAYSQAGGVVQITSTVAESEFYAADTLKRNLTIFEGGAGTKQNPYLISNLQQLDAVRNNLAAHYKLIADINASEIGNWQPIGDGTNYFSGSFDGNGHTISNLNISRPIDQYIGLFGVFQPDTINDSIKNLTMENVNINGYEYCGAVTGYVYNGSIYNCHATGHLQGDYYVGGITGYVETIGKISYCTTNCNIIAFEQEAGGIAGEVVSATITNCSSSGKIGGGYYIGGIGGYLSNSSQIILCHAVAEIQCRDNSGGGIAGFALNSEITKSYHKGNVSGYEYIGGIIGFSENSHIDQCFSMTDVKSENYSGGIAGVIQSGSSLKNCYTTGTVDNMNGNYAGGICGETTGGAVISECYSSGKIISSATTGGINAYTYNSTIRNCAAMNAYLMGSPIGRIMGQDVSTTKSNNYAWKDMIVVNDTVTGTLTDINGLDTTFEILSDSAFYTNAANWHTNAWNFDSVWTLDKNNISPYPVLKEIDLDVQKTKHAQSIYWPQDLMGANIGDTILLTAIGGASGATIYYTSDNPAVAYISGNQLIIAGNGGTYITAHVDSNQYFLADSVKKTVIIRTTAGTRNDPHLIYNLAELEAVRYNLTAHYRLMADLDLSPISNFNTIGDNSTAFIGSFDGNNHTLYNLTMNHPHIYEVGLFAYVVGDTIKDLNLVNADITGYYDVGSIAGQIDGGAIINCHSSGKVTGMYDYIGGIVGNATNVSHIANCGSSCTVSGAYWEVGGIAGWAATSRITNCYFSGRIEGGDEYTGGIVGYGFWDTISNCVVTGNIEGNRYTGGIIGYLENSIVNNCYTTGDIFAHQEYGGGIAGFIKEGDISNCYSSSVIYGNDANSVGGIYGHNNSDTLSQITNCVALNAKIVCVDFYGAGRVAGSEPNQSNCYAWDNMYVNDYKVTDGLHNNQHGENATLTQLKNAAFYQNAANWQGAAWDFASVWAMNSNVSPYPVLQGIADSIQNVKHTQILTNAWTQELPQEGELLQVIPLTAPSEGPSEQLVYTSSNPATASISGDTLFGQNFGNAMITVRYPETPHYKASNGYSKLIIITNKASQTISWNQTLAATYGDANITLNATASSGLSVTYSSDNAAVATVSGNQLIITGAGTANITAMQEGDTIYAAASDVTIMLTVSRRNLALSNFIATDKVYDGTTTATGTGFDDNRITGDVLNFSYNAAFENKNSGVNKNVNFSNIAFSSGADTGNYILANTSGVALADITAKTITVSGTFTVLDKMYDGTTNATINQNNLSLVGTIAGDAVVLHPVAAFASAAVGNNILVSLTAATYLSGTDSLNYTLSLTGAPTTTANITAAPTYTVAFNVTHNSNPISGASININSQVLTTNTSGVTTIDLPNGTYSYSATAAGYDTVSGNITINNVNQNVNVSLTPIGIANVVVKEIKIYPNPIADVLHIQTSQDKAFEVVLRNNNGVIIYTQHFLDGAARIDMKAFATGLYLLEVKTANGVRLEKIQKID